MIKVGNHVINEKDITNYEAFKLPIPYGNEFNVDQTVITVLKVTVDDIDFIIYQNGSESGNLIDNMVHCAMEGKSRYANCMPSNGLEIFQNYYDKYYDAFVWVGVSKPLTEVLETIHNKIMGK